MIKLTIMALSFSVTVAAKVMGTRISEGKHRLHMETKLEARLR